MRMRFPRLIAAVPLALVAVAACGTAARTPATAEPAPLSPAARARADGGRPPYTAADVGFMSGMIVHHAQAVQIAGWAPSHGAGPAVRVLCERIVVAQRDEIAFMQGWLRNRGEPVPDADPGHAHAGTLMPGMLTADQLAELDRARGAEFDRLFLSYMIQHHEGALTMVETLFGANGAAQDEDIFKFAADVNADQTTEIDRMRTMLAEQSPGGRNP
jgi:uncharacterized protein (DUF305 family)